MTLIVKPSKGYLTHNTNFFTNMDPYCYLYLGKQAQKTAPHYGGGIRPQWKEIMKFKIDNIVKLGIEIWTKAMIGNDTLIGQGLLDLSKLKLGKGEHIQEYVDIFFNNKPAGRVLLELQYIAPQVQHKHHQAKKVPQKFQNNGWDIEKKPQRKSWTGDVDWRGSNASNNVPAYQPQSAIYIADGIPNKNKNNPEINQNHHGASEIVEKKDFHKKHQEEISKIKTEQEKVNQYLNQQFLKNFALKQSNADVNNIPPTQKPAANHHNLKQQQMMYDQQKLERKQLEQKKLQEQASQQQYQMMQSPFQNLNNVKPSTGLTPGTIYAQPDKHYNPHRGSNVNLNGEKKSKGKKESHVGIGSTPPKSILTPPKLNRPKSPGKKVHFVDQA